MAELNDKMLKFAGFRMQTLKDLPCKYRHPTNLRLVAPNSLSISPDFPNDLNACFKWLVPKAKKSMKKPRDFHTLLMRWVNDISLGIEPALALCKAIEKLIDSEGEEAQI